MSVKRRGREAASETRRHSAGLRLSGCVVLAALIGCSAGPMPPAAIDPGNDTCAECRMLISDPRMAAQIVAPGEEPRLFDDIGCLRAHLETHWISGHSAIYVADHRTGAWVSATAAVYTRAAAATTSMGSGILAHADPASRDQDAAAAGGEPLQPGDILSLPALERVRQ